MDRVSTPVSPKTIAEADTSRMPSGRSAGLSTAAAGSGVVTGSSLPAMASD